VWVPILRRDGARHLAQAIRRLPDPRVTHFWDPGAAAARRYGAILPLTRPGPAWDVYLLFAPGQRFGDLPTFWMHQLTGNTSAAWLDAGRLAAEIRRLRDWSGARPMP
jgi:hypothetical protein